MDSRSGWREGGRVCPAGSLDAEARLAAEAAVLFPEPGFGGASVTQGSLRKASSSWGAQGGCCPLLGADSRAWLPSTTMSGCSKRCKLGFVKFAQTIFKLITGTLSKGMETGLAPAFCLDMTWLVVLPRCGERGHSGAPRSWKRLGKLVAGIRGC